MRPCVIIANKGAGSFSRQIFDRACSRLSAGGLAVECKFCNDFSEMREVAAGASKLPDKPIVVAAGGDGTINAVFNGLAGNSATCAILPMGTANVMAKELGLKTTEQALSRIICGQSRLFTAGLLSNSTLSSRFFLMAGAGFDGHTVRGVSLREKRLLGKGAYLLSALRNLISWDSGELHVTTESEEFCCSTLIVCNAARYGGSFLLSPSSSIYSPSFDIVAIKGHSRMSALTAVAGTTLKQSNPDRLFRTSASKISINGAKPVQADGDDWGDSPAEILAEPDYARIII